MHTPKSILFVCLGNICRSPTAEAVVRAQAPHLKLDSAGTGDWHVGKAPYPPMMDAARRRGIDMSDLRARQVTNDDFARFDLIVLVRYANVALLAEAAGLLKPGGWLLTEVHRPSVLPVGGPSTDRFRLTGEQLREATATLELRSLEEGYFRDPDGRLMSLVRTVGRLPA